MGVLYLSITDLETIILYDPNNKKDFVECGEKQVKVKIEKYLECLEYIVKICQQFNDALYLFSNELYIIVNLNSIINLLKLQKNEYIDVQIIEKIINNLRQSIDIIRENKLIKMNELKNNVEELMSLISENIQKKDDKYYSLIKNLLIQEIKKVKDKNYRLYLFKSYIINEKEILFDSNEIFDLLIKNYINPLKEMLPKIENKGDEILLLIENKIKDKKNEYLSQILLYYFEKITYIYFENYLKIKKDKKDEENIFEKDPLTIFKTCLSSLSDFHSSKSRIKNISKLLYIGYIRVFLFKFEEFIRVKYEKLKNPKKIIDIINTFKSPLSYMIELYFYKVIFNKNNKDINIFTSENKLYNLELFNNFKDIFHSQVNDDNSIEENNDKENCFIDILNEKYNESMITQEEYPFHEYFYFSDYIDENYLSSNINDKSQKYPVLAKYLELKNNGNILNDFLSYNDALNCLNDEFSTKITREYANKETLDKQLIYKENKNLFTKFFDIYNKLSDNSDNDSYEEDNNENENKINNNLDPTFPLFNFFIIDDNELSEKYKNIYRQFIYKHNEIVGKLFEAKPKIFDVQNKEKNKINIQNITKENQIFMIKNDFSISNITFNNSYRKIIISDDYSEFNKYEINLELIEEIMTDLLLKNKRLISDEIFEFKYKNEDLEFKNKDICTTFKENINEEELSINDKIIIYEYFEQNIGNVNMHLRLLDDFAYLIIYSYENKDKIKEPSQIIIEQLIKQLESISNDFKKMFEEKKNLTLNKLLNIYEYYQILCFNKVKEKLHQYQEKIINEEQKNLINNYIQNDLKKNQNFKNALEIAIRKFILCFLSKENKKDIKIKQNKNNIKNYLEIEDLWNRDFYKKNEFYQEMKKLKNLGIKVNNVIPFYEKCFNNTYKNFFDDVKNELKRREEEKLREEKEKAKEDLSNFNAKDPDFDDNPKEEEENKDEENNKNDDNNNNENENEDNDNGDDYIDEGNDDVEETESRY